MSPNYLYKNISQKNYYGRKKRHIKRNLIKNEL